MCPQSRQTGHPALLYTTAFQQLFGLGVVGHIDDAVDLVELSLVVVVAWRRLVRRRHCERVGRDDY